MNLSPSTPKVCPGGGRTEPATTEGRGARRFSILYAEQAPLVADAVRETLEAEGWRVEVCTSGDEVLRRLQGESRFDLLILDFRLPGLDGLELVRRARALPRAVRTPIIMFTDSEVERDARRAGVDAYLRKPRGVYSLASIAAGLLARV
ncbi:MAG: two-component system, cell cycle response regulator DivK [Acidobacteriota bacterium]|jgi:CheY-like chemotaxis protein|nr:two-component system, cell cycle response regulator DivK [Acidobacteriota bacterium]